MVRSVCEKYCLRLTEKINVRISFHLKEERPAPFIRPFCVYVWVRFPFWTLTDCEKKNINGLSTRLTFQLTFAPDGCHRTWISIEISSILFGLSILDVCFWSSDLCPFIHGTLNAPRTGKQVICAVSIKPRTRIIKDVMTVPLHALTPV